MYAQVAWQADSSSKAFELGQDTDRLLAGIPVQSGYCFPDSDGGMVR